MVVWEENEEGTGAGRAVRPRRSRGADEGLGGVGAHPASLAGRAPGQAGGFAWAVVPHPGNGNGPGAVASAQTQRGVSDRSAGITVSYGHQFRGAKALAPGGDLEPQGLLSNPRSGGPALNSEP